jgi:hypothetical protein
VLERDEKRNMSGDVRICIGVGWERLKTFDSSDIISLLSFQIYLKRVFHHYLYVRQQMTPGSSLKHNQTVLLT